MIQNAKDKTMTEKQDGEYQPFVEVDWDDVEAESQEDLWKWLEEHG